MFCNKWQQTTIFSSMFWYFKAPLPASVLDLATDLGISTGRLEEGHGPRFPLKKLRVLQYAAPQLDGL